MKPWRLTLGTLGLGCLACGQALAAQVDNFSDWLGNGGISGDVRLYDFSRDYSGTASDQPAGSPDTGKAKFNFLDMNAFSAGGKVKAQTADWGGFSAAAAWYFAYDVGLNNYQTNGNKLYNASYNTPYLNPLLMGENRTMDTLGEAWLQYLNPGFMIRAGNELINNPWNNPSDGFMIPNLFQGVSTQISLAPGVQLAVDRILQYKNRTDAAFDTTSLAILPYDKLIYAGNSGGAVDAGLSYKSDQATAALWLYDWYNLASMAYLEAGYSPVLAGRKWFVNGQYVRETGSGDVGSVNAEVYGFKLGMNLDRQLGNVFVAYDRLPANQVTAESAGAPNTVYNGNLYSPYTQIYNTDPLYTTVMNYGLVSARAPGYAWMVGAVLHPVSRLDIIPTVSEYYTDPYAANARAYMLDVAWHCGGRLKGWTIRNRLGIEHDIPLLGTAYVDNRLMLQYDF